MGPELPPGTLIILAPGAVAPPGYSFVGLTTIALRKGNESPGPIAAQVYVKD
jgi:hypothetical protein